MQKIFIGSRKLNLWLQNIPTNFWEFSVCFRDILLYFVYFNCSEVQYLLLDIFSITWSNVLQVLWSLVCNGHKSEGFEGKYELREQDQEKFRYCSCEENLCYVELANLPKSLISAIGDKRNLKFPVVEFIKFIREVKDWFSFLSHFSRIHDDKSIDDEYKFQYFIQCMTADS